MNPRKDVSFEELVDFVESRLDPTRAAEIDAVVATSPALQDQVAWLRTFIDRQPKFVLAAPPQSVRTQLNAAFRAYTGRVDREAGNDESPDKWWRRLVAALTLDSGAMPLAAGVRGAGGASRQLFFSAPFADIVLSIVAAPEQATQVVEVHGQILLVDTIEGDVEPTDADNATQTLRPFAVQLLRGESEVVLTHSDELGEFHLTKVEPAEYELVLSGQRHEFVLKAVPVHL